MERDDFGVPLFEQARRRASKRKRSLGTSSSLLTVNAAKRQYVPVDKRTELTPDDVVATDHAGRMQCDDCKKFSVEKTVDGAYAAYTCTDCGLVSTTQVLEQGFVSGAELTKQAHMDKRALKSNLIGAGAFYCDDADVQLERRRNLIKSSSVPEEMQEKKEISIHLRKKRHERKKELRQMEIGMAGVLEEVLKAIGFSSNVAILRRAAEICHDYIKERAPTSNIRYPLACAAITRAGLENGYGFRAWDFRVFLADHAEDSISLRGGTVVFSDWRRRLSAKFNWPSIGRKDQLKAFVATFAARAKVNETKVNFEERADMSSLTRWMGEAHLNRLTVAENKQRNVDKEDKRKCRVLRLFFQCLPSPSEHESASSIKPMDECLKATSKPKKKDECIRVWSVAASIIYIALSVRTQHRLTQQHIQDITGVKPHVLIACKKRIIDAIETAVDKIRKVDT